MQRLLLIRHGESEWNRDGIIQGFSDCDLSELGREQARKLKQRLDLEHIDVAHTSTATRAHETARIAMGHRLELTEQPDLREMNLGAWEGREAEALKREFPEETSLWFRAPSQLSIEGAEPIFDFRNRVFGAVRAIQEAHPDQGIVIFTHGGAICTYLTALLGLQLDDIWRFKIRNCSITRIIFPMGHPRIEVLNDVSHLDGAVRYAPNTPPRYLL